MIYFSENLIIKRASVSDLSEITRLFYNTVQNINIKDYTQSQVDVWSSGYTDTLKWSNRISEQFFITALANNQIVGFGSLTPDGYLDLLYVHTDYQRKGIAAALLQEIENKAQQQNNASLYSEVSVTAKYFFMKQGFKIEKEQLKKIGSEYFTNYLMRKSLNTSRQNK